ncbi:hypothetical protein GCM10009611_05780 [Arthrobacter roseus]
MVPPPRVSARAANITPNQMRVLRAAVTGLLRDMVVLSVFSGQQTVTGSGPTLGAWEIRALPDSED